MGSSYLSHGCVPEANKICSGWGLGQSHTVALYPEASVAELEGGVELIRDLSKLVSSVPATPYGVCLPYWQILPSTRRKTC